MSWVVDTCVIIDVFSDDPTFGSASLKLLERLSAEGLSVSPVTMVELSVAFKGDLAEQKHFLDQGGISYSEPWTIRDTETAHAAWKKFVDAKRAGHAAKRPVADILIGAYAKNRRGLVTRNGNDFHRWFEGLVLREP